MWWLIYLQFLILVAKQIQKGDDETEGGIGISRNKSKSKDTEKKPKTEEEKTKEEKSKEETKDENESLTPAHPSHGMYRTLRVTIFPIFESTYYLDPQNLDLVSAKDVERKNQHDGHMRKHKNEDDHGESKSSNGYQPGNGNSHSDSTHYSHMEYFNTEMSWNAHRCKNKGLVLWNGDKKFLSFDEGELSLGEEKNEHWEFILKENTVVRGIVNLKNGEYCAFIDEGKQIKMKKCSDFGENERSGDFLVDIRPSEDVVHECQFKRDGNRFSPLAIHYPLAEHMGDIFYDEEVDRHREPHSEFHAGKGTQGDYEPSDERSDEGQQESERGPSREEEREQKGKHKAPPGAHKSPRKDDLHEINDDKMNDLIDAVTEIKEKVDKANKNKKARNSSHKERREEQKGIDLRGEDEQQGIFTDFDRSLKTRLKEPADQLQKHTEYAQETGRKINLIGKSQFLENPQTKSEKLIDTDENSEYDVESDNLGDAEKNKSGFLSYKTSEKSDLSPSQGTTGSESEKVDGEKDSSLIKNEGKVTLDSFKKTFDSLGKILNTSDQESTLKESFIHDKGKSITKNKKVKNWIKNDDFLTDEDSNIHKPPSLTATSSKTQDLKQKLSDLLNSRRSEASSAEKQEKREVDALKTASSFFEAHPDFIDIFLGESKWHKDETESSEHERTPEKDRRQDDNSSDYEPPSKRRREGEIRSSFLEREPIRRQKEHFTPSKHSKMSKRKMNEYSDSSYDERMPMRRQKKPRSYFRSSDDKIKDKRRNPPVQRFHHDSQNERDYGSSKEKHDSDTIHDWSESHEQRAKKGYKSRRKSNDSDTEYQSDGKASFKKSRFIDQPYRSRYKRQFDEDSDSYDRVRAYSRSARFHDDRSLRKISQAKDFGQTDRRPGNEVHQKRYKSKISETTPKESDSSPYSRKKKRHVHKKRDYFARSHRETEDESEEDKKFLQQSDEKPSRLLDTSDHKTSTLKRKLRFRHNPLKEDLLDSKTRNKKDSTDNKKEGEGESKAKTSGDGSSLKKTERITPEDNSSNKHENSNEQSNRYPKKSENNNITKQNEEKKMSTDTHELKLKQAEEKKSELLSGKKLEKEGEEKGILTRLIESVQSK